MGTIVMIGLGSNLGDRKAILELAVASLAETPGIKILAVSSFHETTPVGGPSGQGPFLNAATAVETTLSPSALHERFNDVEIQLGKIHRVRWGARTIDLDLLLFGDQMIHDSSLTVPHPRMAYRRFVLAPLAEIAPDLVLPKLGQSIRQLLARVDRRPSYLALFGCPHQTFPLVVKKLGAIPVKAATREALRESPNLDMMKTPIDNHLSHLSPRQLLDHLGTKLIQTYRSIGDQWIVSDFSLAVCLAERSLHGTAGPTDQELDWSVLWNRLATD